jgi:hypothetical protein
LLAEALHHREQLGLQAVAALEIARGQRRHRQIGA